MIGKAIDAEINNSGPQKRTTANPNHGSHAAPSIPTITLDSDGMAGPTVNRMVPQSNQVVSMATGEEMTAREGSRQVVGIQDIMPESKENKEIPGVTLLESPQAEILKPGGPFDQYVKEKKAEMIERMAQEEEKRQLEAEMAETEGDNEEPTEEDQESAEDKEMEAMEHVNGPAKVQVKGVSRDYTEGPVQAVEMPSVTMDDPVEAPAEKVEKNSEAPFYQTMAEHGFKDNFQYPDNYDGLPTDDEEAPMEEPVEEAESMSQEEYQADNIKEEIDIDSEETNVDLDTDEESGERGIAATKIEFITSEKTDELDESDLETDDGRPTDEQRLEELRSQITMKIKPHAKKLSLEGWTIADKATSSNKIFESKEASAGKWILPATGVCIEMREVSGQKIEYLRENMANNPTAAKNRLRVLYDHVTSPKPQSFEAWCKSIAYADYDHLFMPMYLAAFADSNYMPQTCAVEAGKLPKDTGCGKMFLSENIEIMKCVKFKDEKSKQYFWDLYDSNRYNSEGLYASEITPISDKFAIGFCEPTLYSVLFETGSYGREFAAKYDNVIAFMPYIAKIYWMDYANKKLVEVKYKEYVNNTAKTAKSKVIRYSNVFDTFTTDQYTNLVSIINAINEKYDWFTYQIPEMTCPECKRVIPAEDVTAASLVFTRHRLGILANTSIS